MADREQLACQLRVRRQALCLSQDRLAAAVGITRQTIIAIESGRYAPNTAVALRLARSLACRVEDLFALPTAASEVTLGEPALPEARLAVAPVRGRLVGWPLAGRRIVSDSFDPADAVAVGTGLRLLMPPEQLAQTALLLGCDPAFGLLGAHVARRGGGRLHCLFASSQSALDALAAGHVHLAGSHLHEARAECNVSHASTALATTGGTVVAFAEWEQGLMVAPGNPFALRGVADLAGGRVRLVNRELGAGSRAILDEHLARAGIDPAAVAGYASHAASHLAAARLVAAGAADAAVGLRAVAEACGCDFVPFAAVRCDLVVPDDLAAHPTVSAALDVLQSSALRDELSRLPGYDASRTGSVIARIPRAA